MSVVINSASQLVEAIPHLLRFEPENSLVVATLGSNGPTARVDLPTTPEERVQVATALGEAYSRSAPASTAILVFSPTPGDAEDLTRQVAAALEASGNDVVARLWAGEDTYSDFETGIRATRDRRVVDQMAAEFAVRGQAVPLASRKELEESFASVPEQVARIEDVDWRPIPGNQAHLPSHDRAKAWAVEVLQNFRVTKIPLTDAEAARMLHNLGRSEVSAELALRMTRRTADEDTAFFKDLTRRSPEDLIAPVASLAALGAYLRGDGASSWIALDRAFPHAQAMGDYYGLGALVGGALKAAMPPQVWEKVVGQAINEVTISPAGSTVPRPKDPPSAASTPTVGPRR